LQGQASGIQATKDKLLRLFNKDDASPAPENSSANSLASIFRSKKP
jgi:hypothetical protein